MTSAETKVAVVVIAAGASSRLGTPKQLLSYGSKPLLQHVMQVAVDSATRPVIVVLGANERIIKSEIDFTNSKVVINEDWQEGMASSIRCGIEALVQIEPLIDGAIIMLCDQPYVTSALLNNLVTAYLNNNKLIVASEYDGVLGAPAFFQKSIFPELLQLSGDAGAKVIIQRHGKQIATVKFAKGSVDIDTATDYEELSKRSH